MNLHQLRFVREAVRQNFNLTEAAKVLFTSQPGVSKAIIELENELGVDIFRRHGKRIRGLTEPGRVILNLIELIMQQVDDLKRIGTEYAVQDSGTLIIAATHMQARWFLPKLIPVFTRKYPKVKLSVIQGRTEEVAEMVRQDKANLAVVTDCSENDIEGLASFSCRPWEFHLVIRHDHPLNTVKRLSFEEIVRYPLITYDKAFSGRIRLESLFLQYDIKPDIRFEATDTDVIKTYASMGLGVGIIVGQSMIEEDANFRVIPVGHLLGSGSSRILLRSNAYLRGYIYDFIEMLSPRLRQTYVDEALQEINRQQEMN